MANDYRALPADALLRDLEVAGRTPDLDLLRACLERREELTPGLLRMLGQPPDPAWPDDDPRWYAHIHAGMLLIAYQEPAALPVFGQLLHRPDQDEVEGTLEWFGTQLGGFGPAATPFVIDWLNDPSVCDPVHTSMTEVLVDIASHHPSERGAVLAALRAKLPPEGPDGKPVIGAGERAEPPELWTWAALALAELRDAASRDRVAHLYAAGVTDEFIIGDVDDCMAIFDGKEPYPHADYDHDLIRFYAGLHEQERREQEFRLKQAIAKAGERQPKGRSAAAPRAATAAPATNAPYVRPEPKVGRNDPCPCGSGLKYKRCHGK